MWPALVASTNSWRLWATVRPISSSLMAVALGRVEEGDAVVQCRVEDLGRLVDLVEGELVADLDEAGSQNG